MVKLRLFLTVALVTAASVQTFAGWRIVIDKNCIKVVAANTASQKLIEDQHITCAWTPSLPSSRRWNSTR